MAFGGCFGWSSVNFIVLQSNETPLTHGPLTLGEASWVVALLMFGCFWGNLLFGYVSEHFGRKWPLFWMAVPQIVSFFFERDCDKHGMQCSYMWLFRSGRVAYDTKSFSYIPFICCTIFIGNRIRILFRANTIICNWNFRW